MNTILATAAFGLASIGFQASPPLPAQAPAMSQENTALLRCSAAFALVSYGQANGEEAALKWPAVDPRGREFFVRALARLIDDTGLDREAVAALAEAEAKRLLDQQEVDAVMPACLSMLDGSGV